MIAKAKRKYVRKTVESAPTEASYKATLRVMGKALIGKGTTTSSAIANIDPQGNVRGRGILSIEKDGQTRERVLMPMVVARLFAHGLTREVAIKNLATIF